MIKKIVPILINPLLLLLFLASCGHGTKHKLDMAYRLLDESPDSAYITLREVDYTDLDTDSLRAKYILTKAMIHKGIGRSLVTDTLLSDAVAYYSSVGDTANWLEASQLLSRYDVAVGNPISAFQRLDSIITLVDDPELLWDIHLNAVEIADDAQNPDALYAHADWLANHTDNPVEIIDFMTAKSFIDYTQGNFSRAVAAFDTIIARGYPDQLSPIEAADFLYNYADLIDGAGYHREAVELLEKAHRSTETTDTVTLVSRTITAAKIYANAGDLDKAMEYLGRINHDATITVFEVYMFQAILKAAIQFRKTGVFPTDLMYRTSRAVYKRHLATELDRYTALESVLELNEDKYHLQLQKHRLWVLVSSVTLLLVIGCGVGYIIMTRRKQRLVEAEERAETLAQMLKDAEKAETGGIDRSAADKLKASLLRQIGIIKTFAGAPTQQSRDALKKISGVSLGADSVETLVDWPMVYSMIDDLYEGFHSKLLNAYPDTFTDKELQIIALLKAGFSTKEIGVLTEQSSATVYVRKTSIRKKLHTPENGDFIAQLDDLFTGKKSH
ncbi:MAG: LuxR C-terminal-related transcriptional regulator [Muribaculaceae bacterium]|nr:LuxR C-terminal-related transcriptional regulator [Muribaculaceae bacterium]